MEQWMRIPALVLLLVVFTCSTAAELEKVGSVTFPTSGSSQAQDHFLRGVTFLHSFGWEQAIEEFHRAQALDPDFAMAYWGESQCYNHPLITEQDIDTSREVLRRLGNTSGERLAKATTDREKGFIRAVEQLFFPDLDYGTRRRLHMRAMGQLHERFPEDQEIAAFYALSILSGGDRSPRMNVKAGAIAVELFNANPNHPGAAHYTIHAFDDPVHAPLALRAAFRFADIAPAVSHARHMPSHIFIQHGRWDEVSRSNESAFQAALDLWKPGRRIGDMVHSLDWGQYGDLQRGDYERATMWIARLEDIIEKTDQNPRAVQTLGLLKARYVIETEDWRIDLLSDTASAPALLASGMSALALGEPGSALRALGLMKQHLPKSVSRDSSYYARTGNAARIMYNELQALIALQKGDEAQALALLQEGVEITEGMRPPSGTANPIKPVHELLGDVLLETGKIDDAIALYEKSLERTPNRSRSLLGISRAHVAAGDHDAAMESYARLAGIWKGRDIDGLHEAERYLSSFNRTQASIPR